MGLFSKKYCDICGEKIGLFGNRKLEDGNMCSKCADRLSPWFDERRHSTLEEIKGQLEYREKNREDVKNFHCSLDLGERYHVLFDEAAGTFVVVTEAGRRMLDTVNPDVFHLSQVKDARVKINDYRSELYRTDSDGNRVSYNPRRYRYRYNFHVLLNLDHPYADEIDIQINENDVEIEWEDRGFSLFTESFSPRKDFEYRKYQSMGDDIVRTLLSGVGRAAENREEQETVEAPEAPAREETVVCPYCGSTVKRAKFCTNCGAGLSK